MGLRWSVNEISYMRDICQIIDYRDHTNVTGSASHWSGRCIDHAQMTHQRLWFQGSQEINYSMWNRTSECSVVSKANFASQNNSSEIGQQYPSNLLPCARVSRGLDYILSPLSIIQYVGLYVFSLPISLVMIDYNFFQVRQYNFVL